MLPKKEKFKGFLQGNRDVKTYRRQFLQQLQRTNIYIYNIYIRVFPWSKSSIEKQFAAPRNSKSNRYNYL